jgi:hypothetical protein
MEVILRGGDGMDVREFKVKTLIREKANFVVGGWENSIADGHIETMPAVEDMEAEIYGEVMSARWVELKAGLALIKKDIRFLGTKRIKELISTITAEVLET